MSTYRRTSAVGAGITLSVCCWLALDQPPGTKVWDFYTGAAIQSSAAVGRNGVVYFGTDSGKLYAFYPDGRGQWEFPTGDRIVASPAVGEDGTIYFGSYNGIFYAIAPEGVERWRFRADGPISSSAAIGPDGTICFGTLNNRLFALRPDGSKVWDLASSDPVIASPAVTADGMIYVPSADGVLAAIDLGSGDVRWEFEAPNRILSSPAIGADGTIYFGCFDGHLYAIDRQGRKKWTFATGGPVRGSAAIGPDGSIIFGSDDRQLYSLAPDGYKRWTFTVGKWIRSTPAIAGDGTVYFGSYDHSLYAVGANGEKKWEFVTDHNVTASAAVAADGTVFFGSWSGRFYAVRGGASLADGAWPRFHGNSRQTGYVGRQPTPTPPVNLVRSTPKETPPVSRIEVRQESGSVLGNWWRRLRSRKEPAPRLEAIAAKPERIPAAKVGVSEPTLIESTTTVVAEASAVDPPATMIQPAASEVGTMTPVWETPKARVVNSDEPVATVAVVPSAAGPMKAPIREPIQIGKSENQPLDGAKEELAPSITVRQESGSVLGNWWRGLRKTDKRPEPVDPPRLVAAPNASATVTDGRAATVETMTTVTGSARETASPSVVVVTNRLDSRRERAYQAQLEAMRHRVSDLEEQLRSERTRPPPEVSPVAAAPRVIADSRDLMPVATNTVLSAREQAYQAEIAEMDSRARKLDEEIARKRSLEQATVVKPREPETRVTAGSGASPRDGMIPMMTLISGDEVPVKTEPPAAPKTSVPDAPTTPPPAEIKVSPPGASFEGIQDIEAAWGDKAKSIQASRPAQDTASVGEPNEVTARERNYQPGFFQRMFTRVKGSEATEKEVPAAASSAPKVAAPVVIADSVTLVDMEAAPSAAAGEGPTQPKPAPMVSEREALLESRITALEKHLAELNTQLDQRETDRVAPPVQPVAVSSPAKTVETVMDDAGTEVGVTPVLAETKVERVIADSADLMAPNEPKIEEVFVDRNDVVVQPEPEAPLSVVPASGGPQPGVLNQLFTRSSSKESRKPAIILEPTVVEVFEREYQPGFFQRLVTGEGRRSTPAVREVSSSPAAEAGAGETAAVVTANVQKPVAKPAVEAVPAPEPKADGFDAKLVSMEERLSEMRDELKETKKERDELKRQIGSGVEDEVVGVAVTGTPASRESESKAMEESGTKPAKPVSADMDPAIQKAYGEKISKLESHLVSLSEELGNARVERARLREELAKARQGGARPSVPPVVPVVPVKPEEPLPSGVQGTVIADSALLASPQPEPEIPQPEWLKQEVRSVIATADPWAQPPGSTRATVEVPAGIPPAVETVETGPGVSVAPVTPAKVVAEVSPASAARVEEEPAARPEKRRKPGLFSRLFGRGDRDAEERVLPATNVVVVPPTASGAESVAARPTEAQLMGNDAGFGSGAVQTNFPRVAFTPGAGTSFFTPGVGNVTQLPGFPRPQPKLAPPPTREMNPTKISPSAGLQTVEVPDVVTQVASPDAGVPRVEDLSVHRPVVAIMSPADGATLAGPVLDLRGLAQGERRIAQVSVSLDGGPFRPAAGLERWSFQSPVSRGHVLVRVKAVDAAGRESEIVERSFGHEVSSRLSLEVTPGGRVEPDLNGRMLSVGKAYGVRAVPDPGFVFAGWAGGVTSAEADLTFQMSRDLYLRAEFRPAAPSRTAVTTSTPASEMSRLRGAYTGLCYPSELLQPDRSGSFDLRVEDDGTFTGEIRLGFSSAPLRGRFDRTGRASQTIERPGEPPVTFRFTREDEGARITGFFDADGVPIVMRAYRAVADGDTLAVITPGRYTLVIPGPPDVAGDGSPAGDGFGEVRIDAGGHLKFTGELPDGSKVEQVTRISSGGIWPLYVPLYGGEGMLTGWITVTNHPTLDLHGDLRWIKPARAPGRYYPEGFATRRFVFGSIYRPSHDDMNKRKGLAGVLLGGNLGRLVLGQDPDQLPLTSPERETLRQFDYSIDPNSGRVEGTFLHPETRQSTAFRGMMVQKRGWKSGYFMGADASGVVHLNGR